MAYVQAGELLGRVRRLHERLRDWCDQHGDLAGDPRVVVLLDLLRGHENAIQAGLAKIRADADDLILETWLQYDDDRAVRAAITDLELGPDLGVDDLVGRVAHVERALGVIYHLASSSLVPPRVSLFFGKLHELHEARGRQYGRLIEGLDASGG